MKALLPNICEGHCARIYTVLLFGTAKSAPAPSLVVYGQQGQPVQLQVVPLQVELKLPGEIQPERDGWTTRVGKRSKEDLDAAWRAWSGVGDDDKAWLRWKKANLKPDYDTRPDYGNDDKPRRCFYGDDKSRTRRNSRPRRRPSSEMARTDGSPLRIGEAGSLPDYLTVGFDASDQGWGIQRGVIADDRIGRALPEISDDEGPSWERFDGHGDGIKYNSTPGHLLERCELCSRPLPLAWTQSVCEFMDQPLPFELRERGVSCRCNGCLAGPVRGKRRPRYCGKRCSRRMDNALDRAGRRAEGAKSRTADSKADRRADYKVAMKLRARQSKAETYETDRAVWSFPTTKPMAG